MIMIRLSHWGVWKGDFGLGVIPQEKWELRKDLTGIHLMTATADEPPYGSSLVIDPDNLPRGYKVIGVNHEIRF